MTMPNTSPTEPTDLEKAIARLHDDMLSIDPETDKYTAMVDNLTKLYKLRDLDMKLLHELALKDREHDLKVQEFEMQKTEMTSKSRRGPSPDVVLTVAANLLGIGMIIKHEDVNVITTKAMGFVKKLG